ncbi:response regulator [Peptostreptococcaceae bacterium AGR-M142]
MDFKAIVIDDEKQILKSLRRLFIDLDWECYFFSDGNEAIEFMEEEDIDLLITDIMMPQIGGKKILEYVKNNHNQVIRLVITGYTDEDIFNLIREDLAQVLIFKPWNNENLLYRLKELEETYLYLKNNNLYQNIINMNFLPMKEKNKTKVLEYLSEEKSLEEVIDFIYDDLILSINIFKIANNIELDNKIGSLKKAVKILGIGNMTKIIECMNVIDLPKFLDTINNYQLFLHKLFISTYKDIFGEEINDNIKDVCLFLNISYLYYFKMKEAVSLDDAIINEEYFRENHERISYYILKWWGFSKEFCDIALYHHNPLNYKGEENISRIIHFINICNTMFLKQIEYEQYYKDNLESSIEYLNLNDEHIKILERQIDILKGSVKI